MSWRSETLRVSRPLSSYAIGVAFMSAALLLRWLLDPYLGEAQPLSLLFGAVALTVWMAGFGPALCATVFGYFCSDYLFMEPRGVIAIRSPHQLISLITYGTSSGVIIVFGEALRRANARVRDHALSLEAKQRQLELAERNKDRFITTLSHELRSPLAAIAYASALLKSKVSPAHDVDSELGILERQTEQIKRLIEDLLDLTRIARGELRLDKERVAIADVLASAVEATRYAMEQRGHRLATHLHLPNACVDGDQVRLTQVFVNLLSNAARYTPNGGTISITTRLVSRHITVAVRDSGIGIAPHKVERVFEMFFQGDEGSEHHRPGLGIGLALVKRIVELHGGNVSVQSDGVGCGSQFIVQLPLAFAGVASPPSRLGDTRSERLLGSHVQADAHEQSGGHFHATVSEHSVRKRRNL